MKKNIVNEKEDVDYTYGVIKAMRAAAYKYFEDEGIDGAYWNIDIEVYELDESFEPLKKVKDWNGGINRFYKNLEKEGD